MVFHRRAVFTANFGAYDTVLPPVLDGNEGIDFYIISDTRSPPPGWKLVQIECENFHDARSANRFFKMLGFSSFSEYHSTLYLDSNIAIIGSLTSLFQAFERSAKPIGVFAHPTRTTVQEEVEACLELGKLADRDLADAEIRELLGLGFEEVPPLLDGGLLFRLSKSPDAEKTMRYWSNWYSKWQSRDQLSLPFALAASGICPHLVFESPRLKSDVFAFHRHMGGSLKNRLIGSLQRATLWLKYRASDASISGKGSQVLPSYDCPQPSAAKLEGRLRALVRAQNNYG